MPTRLVWWQSGPSERGRRRFRLSVRSLMALPVLIGLGIFLVDRLWTRPWTQRGTELVEFQVIDAPSGRPMAQAVIELTGGPTQVASTRPDGTVAFAVPYKIEGETSLLR